MTLAKRINAKKQVLKGRLKQSFGRATGNTRMKTRGRTDRFSGKLKQSGEKARNAFRH